MDSEDDVFQDSCRVDHSSSRHLNLSFRIQIDGANQFPVAGFCLTSVVGKRRAIMLLNPV